MAYSQGYVALGVKRACHWVSELGLPAVCKTLELHQTQDMRAALVATCLRETPVGASELEQIGTVFCLPLSLPCPDVPLTASLKVG